MSYQTKHRFQLDGELLAFGEMKKGLPKSLILRSDGTAHELKIAKPLRSGIRSVLKPGARIRVHGKEKRHHRQPKKKREPTKIKRKIVAFTALREEAQGELARPTADDRVAEPSVGREIVVQVCTKGNCWKRGGEQLWNRLKAIQAQSDAVNRIRLQSVHCLDRCKKGPCLRCLPEGQVRCRMDTTELNHLFSNPAPSFHSEEAMPTASNSGGAR